MKLKELKKKKLKLQIDAKKAEEAALQAEKDRQKLIETELLPNSNKSWTGNKIQEKEIV